MTKPSNVVALLLLSLSLCSNASAVTLTFEELPAQPVHGLTFSGVTFSFVVSGSPSTDAIYGGAFGLGTTLLLEDPSLVGTAEGVLTLDFLVPTNYLSFAVARNTVQTLLPGFTVELFSPALDSILIGFISTQPLIFFSENGFVEGSFGEDGFVARSSVGLRIKRAIISFDDPAAASRFALDNLTFTIPEPATVLLVAGAMSGLLLLRGRRRGQI